ncbi:membrane protein insertase YidC [Leucobacter sp. CSA2]|uniref:Membrane protein insertase YidC n=1 Tax=Leucobacter edaphi TaxID=2796472 RepID=A0A934QCM4_9MICO|nr:membrane protein insertase YidC [Leucobacter edaphi]
MNIYDFPPIRALISGVYWLVTRLSELLDPLAGSASAALAVIALTIVVRMLLIPVGRSQVRANFARMRLAPKLQELQARYGKNPEVLQRKTMELYREENASPFAGCLPMLAQTPVLMAVYGVFIRPTIDGAPNALLTHDWFGVPLGKSFVGMIGAGVADPITIAVFLGIMIFIALVAQASRKLLATPAPEQATPPPAQNRSSSRDGVPNVQIPPGLIKGMSFLPFMTAVFAAFVPLAAALYLATTTAWTLGERLILTRIYRPREGTETREND